MILFFKTLTGRVVTLEGVLETTTFRELKEQLAQQSGVPVDEQKIICAGCLVDGDGFDDLPLAEIKIGQPPKLFLEVAQSIATLHLIQNKSNSKPDLKSEALNFQTPKLYWRLRQLDRTSAATDKYLEEKNLASVTVCETLEQAFLASKIRQEYNTGNNQISIIEAVVIDESQKLQRAEAGKKYGADAISLLHPQGENLKIATVGYFKQSSPQFVTLRERPTGNDQQNQLIAAEVNLAVGRLLAPSDAVIGSEAPGASEEVSRRQMIEDFFRSADNPFPAGSLRYQIYEALIDPVSFQIMENPVILLPSGQTLDQESAQGLQMCPITRLPIEEMKSNEAIQRIVSLLSVSRPEEGEEVFEEKLNQLIQNLNYNKEAASPRDFRLESIIECVEAKNQKRSTLNSGQRPTISLEPAPESILNPDNSVAASKVSQEKIDRITQALQAYVARIDGYGEETVKYRSNLSFSFFQDSQAVNREANYQLAKALIQLVEQANGDLNRLQMIFSADQIKQQRNTIIGERNLAAKASPHYNLGIHSERLNEAIDLAKQLLTNEANTPSAIPPQPKT